MPTQDVLASRPTRQERADRDFHRLFTGSFPALAHEVHRIVGDRAVADAIARDAFFRLLTRWRTVSRAHRPEAWVLRVALVEAEAAAPGSAAQVGGSGAVGTAADWEPLTDIAYAAVMARMRRHRVRRNRTLAGAAIVVAIVGGLSFAGASEPDPPRSGEPADLVLGPPWWVTNGVGSAAGSELPHTALEGRWHTAALTRADIAGALRRAGLGEYADYAASFPTEPFRIDLTVRAERSVLTIAGDQRFVAILRVEGNRVTLEPLPPNIGYTHFRWTRDHRRLSLRFTGTGLAKAKHDAIPTEVYEVSLFAAAPFTRI